jgi:hypothetical protein
VAGVRDHALWQHLATDHVLSLPNGDCTIGMTIALFGNAKTKETYKTTQTVLELYLHKELRLVGLDQIAAQIIDGLPRCQFHVRCALHSAACHRGGGVRVGEVAGDPSLVTLDCSCCRYYNLRLC